jgi:thiol-disulfide isomerase/thioredoxin
MTSGGPYRQRGALIALAAVAGIGAGTAAVYVSALYESNAPLPSVDCGNALAAAARAAPFAKGEVAAFRTAKTGDPLEDLVFTGPDGRPTGLAAFSGKTLLVNLWATWCVPCRAEMPTLDRLAKERNGADFAVLAVDVDDVAEAAKRAPAFLQEIGVENLPFYSDPSLGMLNAVKKRGIAIGLPTTLLVDPKGCRIGVLEGPAVWDSADARALLDAAAGMQPASPAQGPLTY